MLGHTMLNGKVLVVKIGNKLLATLIVFLEMLVTMVVLNPKKNT